MIAWQVDRNEGEEACEPVGTDEREDGEGGQEAVVDRVHGGRRHEAFLVIDVGMDERADHPDPEEDRIGSILSLNLSGILSYACSTRFSNFFLFIFILEYQRFPSPYLY